MKGAVAIVWWCLFTCINIHDLIQTIVLNIYELSLINNTNSYCSACRVKFVGYEMKIEWSLNHLYKHIKRQHE